MSCIVAPGCPFGRPGLRPVFPRSDFGSGLASPSCAACWSSSSSASPAPPGPRPGPAALPAAPAGRRSARPAQPAAPAAGRWRHAAPRSPHRMRLPHRAQRAYRAPPSGSHGARNTVSECARTDGAYASAAGPGRGPAGELARIDARAGQGFRRGLRWAVVAKWVRRKLSVAAPPHLAVLFLGLSLPFNLSAGSWVILRILQAYRNVASEYVQIGHRPRAVAERAGPGNPGGAGRAGSDAPAACHRDRSGGARGDRRCAADRGWPSSPGACKAGSLERARRRPWSVEGGVARTLVAGPLVARTLVAGQLVAAGPRDAGPPAGCQLPCPVMAGR